MLVFHLVFISACSNACPNAPDDKTTNKEVPIVLSNKIAIPALDPRIGRIYFYRKSSSLGAKVQPDVLLNGSFVGKATPGSFFYIDRPPSTYSVFVSIKDPRRVENSGDSFWLEPSQTVYIRLAVTIRPRLRPFCDHVDSRIGTAELSGLAYDRTAVDPLVSARDALALVASVQEKRKAAQEAQERRIEVEKQLRMLADERLQDQNVGSKTWRDSARVMFRLEPSDKFSAKVVTELLITWKTRYLASLVRNAKTEELRDYVDQIEHTVLEATDASEKEKDEAQRLIAGGATSGHEHTELARAYRLRIEVLKPILGAIKEEIANRAK